MKITSNPQLRRYEQKLRKEMTPEERKLWFTFLKHLPVTVNRQMVIGPVIVDFCCYQSKLVIELDGTQHRSADGVETDIQRDRYLGELGFTVLRYSNEQIRFRFTDVCRDIESHLKGV